MYIDEFVEDLSNCIGFISGDELILKKNRYDFEYEIITRNRDKKLGSIKWDTDYHCIVILLNNKSYSFDRSELTIEKTKEIGKMINKAYYNMNESLESAKKLLKENGYILEDKLQESSKNLISPDVDELVNDIMAHPCFDQYADEWDYYSLAQMSIEWLQEFLDELETQEDPEL